MILSVFEDQSVGIVHPAVSRCVMIDGTEDFAIGDVKRVCHLEVLPSQSVGCKTANHNGVTGFPAERKGHGVVNLADGKTHVHRDIAQHHLSLSLLLLDGEQEIFGIGFDACHGEGVALMRQMDEFLLSCAGTKGDEGCAHEASREKLIHYVFHGFLCFWIYKVRK